jgi:hypothetical protein
VAGAAAIVVAVELLRSQPGPAGSAAAPVAPGTTTTASVPGGRIITPTEPLYPSPPPGAVVLGREAGTRVLALAVVPASPRSLVRVSVVDQQGAGERRLDVSVGDVALSACGPGCYQGEAPTTALRGRIEVFLGPKSYAFVLPSSLDLRNGAATVAHATRVWRALQTLVWHERLAATPTDALYTVYRAVAPDELAYTIDGRSSSIIIGTKRWDRPTPNARWVESPQLPPVRQPQPFWSGYTDARVLGEGSVAGRPVWIVSFFDPITPAWFEARIEKGSGRTLLLGMTAAAHFMKHVYGPFDAPFQLHPPST